jgi:hypothetical protein
VWPTIGLGRKSHRKREESEASRQSQGPRAKCGLACRTEAAADGKANYRRQNTRRSVARLGYNGRIAPEQPSPISIAKRVTLLVITAVDGVPLSEICTSAFCTAIAETPSMPARIAFVAYHARSDHRLKELSKDIAVTEAAWRLTEECGP